MEKENDQEWAKGCKLSTSSSANYVVGASVRRDIEGIWFHAIVQSSCCRRRRCTIKYIDDNNTEDVSFEDLRSSENIVSNSIAKQQHDDNNNNHNNSHRGPQSIKDTLPKPLVGMLVDDSEIRSNHLPTITVHTDDTDTEENVIIINGGKLGVGGGLRALRYLKN